MGIADASDTMTTKRTYREVVSQEEALQELRRCSGTQFDPEFVEVFCRAINEAAKQDQDPCCVNRNCYRMVSLLHNYRLPKLVPPLTLVCL